MTTERTWSALRPVLPAWAASQAAIAIALAAGAASNGERILHTWIDWDAGWFRQVAVAGYGSIGTEDPTAFYPLYPAAMRLAGGIPWLNVFSGGVAVSLLSSLAAFALLYRLADLLFDSVAAMRAVLYLAVFPTVVFTQLVYSESLFLALAIGTFLAAERRRLVAAGALAGLALLTRPVGFALLPALALLAIRERRSKDGAIGIAVALGLFSLYPVYLVEQGRSPLAFIRAEHGWERHLSSLGPLRGVSDGVRAARDGFLQLTWGSEKPYWNPVHSNHEALVNVSGLVALLVVLALLLIVAVRLPLAYTTYVVVALAMPLSFPADSRPLQSMSRFALVLFPCFIALGSLRIRPVAHIALMTISAALALGAIGWWTSGWFIA